MLLNALTDNEKKDRNLWLILFVIRCTLGYFVIFTEIPGVKEFEPVVICGMVFIGFLYCYWFYRCAYKKHGIILLTITLILAPFGVIKEVVQIAHQEKIWMVCYSLVDIALCVWWYILSLRLRKVNLTLRAYKKAQLSAEHEIA